MVKIINHWDLANKNSWLCLQKLYCLLRNILLNSEEIQILFPFILGEMQHANS